MKYHLVKFGCQMNITDGERISTILSNMGYEWTPKEEDANLIGILACSVRQKSINKAYSRINLWNKWKVNKSLLTFVTGCILRKDREKFLKLFDIILQIKDIHNLENILKQYGVNSALQHNFNGSEGGIDKFWQIKPRYTSTFESYIPIQNGCDKFCSFCAVPYTRGRESSRSSKEILAEIENLINHDYKSITLLGQNVNSYGLDKNGKEISFAKLLDKIGKLSLKLKKDFWLYFTSPHPRDMTHDVIDVIANYKCLAKQIHLPLQSGDDIILQKMNRNHDIKRYRNIVNYIRKKLPTATLFTDIIVGFSDEGKNNFENTINAMKEFNYNMAYIAQYSQRPGAKSCQWQDNVPKEIKKERLNQATEILKLSSNQYTKSQIGKTLKVLVTGRHPRQKQYLSGYSEGRINVRFLSNNNCLIGKFVHLKMTASTEFSLEGKIMN